MGDLDTKQQYTSQNAYWSVNVEPKLLEKPHNFCWPKWNTNYHSNNQHSVSL